MSILIKGFGMPKSCSDCRFYDDNHDYPTCITTGYSRGYNWSPFNQRMPDCPLEENNDNWISVKELLPSESGNYLIVVSGTTELDYYSKMIGWDCDGVTHWMPLPEPPEGSR